MAFLEDGKESGVQKELPQILLLGDSIRIGYCEGVKELLSDKYEVCYPSENCRYSQHIYVSLSFWKNLVGPCPKAVYFNCGHWDACHWDGDEKSLNSVEEYGIMLVRIVDRIRKMYPNTKVFFATTTPMNPNGAQSANKRTTEEIIRYNDEAKRRLAPLGVKINDLFDVAKDFGENDYVDYCHYTKEAFQILGTKTAEFLLENI